MLFKDWVKTGVPLAQYTTIKIGGLAQYFAEPNTLKQLKELVTIATENNIDIYVLGNGSNLLVDDEGIQGVVIRTKYLRGIRHLGDGLFSFEAGVSIADAAMTTLKYGYRGLEGGIGIPGTIGAAVLINAGTTKWEMAPLVKRVYVLDRFGRESLIESNEIIFSYRSTNIDRGLIVVALDIQLVPYSNDEVERIRDFIKELLLQRKAKLPLEYPNMGSVFKNPQKIDVAAGKLIDESGCKGINIGDAEVSKKHANFIINKGNATSKDVISLIEVVRKKVQEQFGISLETEVIFWN